MWQKLLFTVLPRQDIRLFTVKPTTFLPISLKLHKPENKKILRLFGEADLFVIDDLFLRKRIPDNAADDLLDIILTRYGKRKAH